MLDWLGWLTVFKYLNFSNATSSTWLFQLSYLHICSMTVLKGHQNLCSYNLGFKCVQENVAEMHLSASLTLRCTNDPNVAAGEGQNSPAKTCSLEDKAQQMDFNSHMIREKRQHK